MDSNKFWDKKIDNELKKKEMEEKYGAHFSGGENISPDLEREWLNSIEEFEKQHHKAKQIPIWDYIGKPKFKKVEELQNDEVTVELQRLYEILGENNISLDTTCEVDDKELYRFITEELFLHEMDNIRIKGMMSCFIYEEFHPNAEQDIEDAIDYFFRMTLGKSENIGGEGYDLLYIDTVKYENANGVTLYKNKVESSINSFLDSFDKFKVIRNEIELFDINKQENDAIVKFDIHYQGLFDKSNEKVDFEGYACFKLKPSEYGGWSIYHINLPGLNI